jgi:subtilisin family serine protease
MGWSNIRIALLFTCVASSGWAQVNRYVVFFKDKVDNGYTVDSPDQFLSQRSISRRIRQGIAVNQQDLPVTEAYVQSVRDAGAKTFFKTKWMNGVLVQCNEVLIPIIQSLPFVDRVEFVAPNERLLTGGRKRTAFKTKDVKTASSTQVQLQMIGLDEMHSGGYEGDDIIIGIFDGGFQGVNTAAPFQHIFNQGRINLTASKDFVTNSNDVFQYDDHGTQVFSVIAAYQDGFYIGGSYEADYQLYVTEDVITEYRVEEYNWLFAAERADSAGVDVVNSSLGYYNFDQPSMDYPKVAMDGKTTVVTRAAQMLADRGVVVVCSAGNEGGIAWQIITAPADAKDVLAIANVNSAGMRSGSSSIGPSADGRIKPDVAALGVNTSVIRPTGALGTASGTSLASPLVASLAAGVWQRYPSLTNLEVMDAIRKSANQATSPDNLLGYGIPNFKAVVNYLERTEQKNIFEVYPNPVTRDTITISPFDPTQVTSCRIELVNAQGQVVHEKLTNFSWANRVYSTSISSLAAGIYFVRISWGDKTFAFKIIKT